MQHSSTRQLSAKKWNGANLTSPAAALEAHRSGTKKMNIIPHRIPVLPTIHIVMVSVPFLHSDVARKSDSARQSSVSHSTSHSFAVQDAAAAPLGFRV